MEIQFKTKNDKQLLAVEYWIDDITEQILYGGAKGGGKSFLGASLICADALIYPETHYFIARAELIDLHNFTIPTIHEVFKNWGLSFSDYASYNGQTHCINFNNGSKIFLLACKETPADPMFERFGSMQMTRGWIEEAGEIPESAKANLWLSIGRWKNKEYNLKKKLLITANPKKGWMKREFVDLSKSGTLPVSRKYIQAFATDNKYLPEDYINTLSEEKDIVRRQRLFLGDWDYDEDKDSLITNDSLTDAFSNAIVKDGKKYANVDVARLGKDRTVFLYWDGLELYKIEQFTKQDTFQTEERLKTALSVEQIPRSNTMVDEDGIGGGVVDHVFGVKGFVANSKPLPTASEVRTKQSKILSSFTPKVNFTNLKSQCGYKLAELINERKIRFNVPEFRDVIIEELSALLKAKEIDNDKKLSLIPKDDVKQTLGRSPDIGDAIIHRMWFELYKDSEVNGVVDERIITLQNNHFQRVKNNNQLNSTR